METDHPQVARERAEMPAGTAVILNARTLAADFRRLAQLLRAGLPDG